MLYNNHNLFDTLLNIYERSEIRMISIQMDSLFESIFESQIEN